MIVRHDTYCTLAEFRDEYHGWARRNNFRNLGSWGEHMYNGPFRQLGVSVIPNFEAMWPPVGRPVSDEEPQQTLTTFCIGVGLKNDFPQEGESIVVDRHIHELGSQLKKIETNISPLTYARKALSSLSVYLRKALPALSVGSTIKWGSPPQQGKVIKAEPITVSGMPFWKYTIEDGRTVKSCDL